MTIAHAETTSSSVIELLLTKQKTYNRNYSDYWYQAMEVFGILETIVCSLLFLLMHIQTNINSNILTKNKGFECMVWFPVNIYSLLHFIALSQQFIMLKQSFQENIIQ